MRLGPLILQVCAVLIGLVLVYGGYSYLESRELGEYKNLIEHNESKTPGQRVALFKDAPSFMCSFSIAEFSRALRGKVYVSKGKLRYDTETLSDGKVLHRIFDETGMYFWEDRSEFVEYVASDIIYFETRPDVPVFALDCESWNENTDAFELPLGKPVREYRTVL